MDKFCKVALVHSNYDRYNYFSGYSVMHLIDIELDGKKMQVVAHEMDDQLITCWVNKSGRGIHKAPMNINPLIFSDFRNYRVVIMAAILKALKKLGAFKTTKYEWLMYI